MNRVSGGWLLFIAALGMMCTLLAVDISNFDTWKDGITPAFIGSSLGHIGTVIAAFIGGKLIPTNPAPNSDSEK